MVVGALYHQNWTPRVQEAMRFAAAGMTEFQCSQMDTRFVLYGLLCLRKGIPYNLLGKVGVTIEEVRKSLPTRVPSEKAEVEWNGIRVGKSVEKVFATAHQCGQGCGPSYLGTEHLLFALLEVEGGAVTSWLDTKINRKMIRDEVWREFVPISEEQVSKSAGPAAKEQAPKPSKLLTKDRFSDFALAVRKRPGMFFGGAGERGFVNLIQMLFARLVQTMIDPNRKILRVCISEGESGSQVSLRVDGFESNELTPLELIDFYPGLSRKPWGLELVTTATVSRAFRMTLAKKEKAVGVVILDDGEPAITQQPGDSSSLMLNFVPDASILGKVTDSVFYRIAGIMRDLAILNPGLTTELNRSGGSGLRYWYPEGLRSFVYEQDYARFDVRKELLEFRVKGKGMEVEGYLRLLHAGSPRMSSWVNGHPTQGGSHYEGLGRALAKVWDQDKGCREGTFVTNPAHYKKVLLPMMFLGAMRLEWDAPQYEAPTKDNIYSSEVEEFVYTAALQQLGEQWERIKNST